jgi:hypothetical protein
VLGVFGFWFIINLPKPFRTANRRPFDNNRMSFQYLNIE